MFSLSISISTTQPGPIGQLLKVWTYFSVSSLDRQVVVRQPLLSLLRHSHTLVNLPPETITWCYGEWQPLYSTLSTIHPNLEWVEDLPDLSSFDSKTRNLVVIDDLLSETDERVTKLFTKKNHHCNTSVIYLVQNLFPKVKESRIISINAQYMVIFKNPRYNTQVVNLAKRMYSGRVKYMQEAFRDATSVPHGYLFVELK